MVLLLLLSFAVACRAGADPSEAKFEHLRASLLVDPPADALGDRGRVGVLFDLEPGWHLYWRNPGESGLPTEIDWQHADAEIGRIAWPTPEVFLADGDERASYGYADRVLLETPVLLTTDVRAQVRS